MNKLAAVFLVLAATTSADECADLSAQFAANPRSLTVGQLDTLRICVADTLKAKIEAPQNERELRAIERNF